MNAAKDLKQTNQVVGLEEVDWFVDNPSLDPFGSQRHSKVVRV